jgi:hypothetical protein
VTGPLASFVIIGRNDNYMGDYLYRLGTSVSFLASSAETAGLLDDIEVTIVDWASERPLSQELPLGAAARTITTFLEVTPEIVQSRWQTADWLPACAVNVGVRRSRGEFIFFTDSDCLWTESAMATLGRLLRGEITLPLPVADVFCYVRRYQVPWATVHRQPHLQEWSRVAALLVAGARPEASSAACLGGFSAGQLMHRDLWFAARGYDEALDRPWGWSDNDLMLRVSQEHAWLDVSGYGLFGLHMEHWPEEHGRAARDPAAANRMIIRNQPATNGADWGLADVAVPRVASRASAAPVSGFGCAVPLSGLVSPLWAPGPEAADFVRRAGAEEENPAAPFDQLAAVAHIALADRPRNVYWFGQINAPVLRTILRAAPAAEMFLVNPWPDGASDALLLHPGKLAAFLGAGCRFSGWSRIVQGDPRSALDRIDRSSTGPGPVELAWIDPAMPIEIVRAVSERLAPGGVLLYRCDRNDATMTLARIRGAAPGCVAQVLGGADLVAATRVIPS